MSEVRVKSWPLAVAGSLLLHTTVMTGVYLIPTGAAGAGSNNAAPGIAQQPGNDTSPIYLIPDELPPDVAARLEAERAAAANAAAPNPTPKPDAQPLLAVQPPPPKPLEPIPVALGVVDGPNIKTEAWLKNNAEGENGAIESKVEQPRLDMNAKPLPQGDPGQGGKDGKNGERPVDPATPPTAESQSAKLLGPPAPAVAAVKAQAPVAGSEGAEKPKTDLPEGPSQKEIKAGNAGGETPAKVQPATEPLANPAPIAARPEVVGVAGGAASAPTTAMKPLVEAPGAPGSPGVPTANMTVAADRDADAASIKRSAVFRNGKVEAGEGLDIRTVRPEFSLTTRALLQPRSPTLEIVFGKDGRARSVKVLKSSGFPAQVDEPVVTALYNWRAKGKLLDQLPTRPDAALSLEITIILQ